MSLSETFILVTTEAIDDVPDFPQRVANILPKARIIRKEELKKNPDLIEEVEIIFGRMERDLFPRAQNLKWLQNTGAGMDWAEYPEIKSHPVTLTNARIHAKPISEHLFGMLLMLTRGLHVAYNQQKRKIWEKNSFKNKLINLSGKTLCIIGLGVIGRRCAMLGETLGMRVIGVRRHPQPTPHVEKIYGPEKVNQALSQADVIMVILPNTPDTRKFIGQEEFAAMKRGVLFLNAGRGQTVDTDSLTDALKKGIIGGAGLDVVDPEPLPSEHPLWEMPNVIITPHYSGLFPGYNETVTRLFLENLRRYVNKDQLKFVVDKKRWY